MKKYELVTSDTVVLHGGTLYRIKAIRDFSNVVSGNLGGYVQSEDNLSHEGDAWVFGNAQVYGNAQVSGNVRVYGNAQVFGNVRVYGEAQVFGNARVYGNAWVFGDAQVYGDARVYGEAWVFGNARVFGDAQVNNTMEILVIGPIGSRADYITFTDNQVTTGCFTGTFDGFRKAVLKTHEDNSYAKEYLFALALAEIRFNPEASN